MSEPFHLSHEIISSLEESQLQVKDHLKMFSFEDDFNEVFWFPQHLYLGVRLCQTPVLIRGGLISWRL